MSKPGAGGLQSSQAAGVSRRERLRELVSDLSSGSDPYIIRTYLGHYECKLCATTHANEGNYLAHTQGKRHQTALLQRKLKLQREAQRNGESTLNSTAAANVLGPKIIKRSAAQSIGRPGYKFIRQRNSNSGQFGLLIHIDFPLIATDIQPRQRIMSTFEQKIEGHSTENDKYQYLIVSAEPYENIAFKIPNLPIDKSPGAFVSHWNVDSKAFTIQLSFINNSQSKAAAVTNSPDKSNASDERENATMKVES